MDTLNPIKPVVPPPVSSPGQANKRAAERTASSTGASAHSPDAMSERTHPPLDSYTYEKTSIILVAHFRPMKEEGGSRQVWLSAQNGVGNEQDCPIYRILTEDELGGPWPPAVVA